MSAANAAARMTCSARAAANRWRAASASPFSARCPWCARCAKAAIAAPRSWPPIPIIQRAACSSTSRGESKPSSSGWTALRRELACGNKHAVPNRVRFDGTARRFYEVWYFIFNDPASGDGFWIRYTLLNPLDEHPEAGAALWFAHTCRRDPDRSVAIRRNFAAGDLEARAGTVAVRIGGATFEEGGVRGGFESAGHCVSWDLRYEPSPQPHYYFGDVLRRLSARRTSVTLPNPQIF